MSGDYTKHNPCVCVQESVREKGEGSRENRESQDGDVCEGSYTRPQTGLVSLVSSVVVLVWYHKFNNSDTCGTRSSTTIAVVQ